MPQAARAAAVVEAVDGVKRACDSMRDEPFKIVIPIKPDFGGPIATQGTVGEFIDLYKVVQTEGVGIANSFKLARFAALLWKTIERRPHAERVFDVMLPPIWSSGNVRIRSICLGFDPGTLKLRRCLVTEPAMCPVVVVLLAKGFQSHPRLCH